MTAVTQSHGLHKSTSITRAIDQACGLIAPTWPLDRFIAVNPWWQMIDKRPEYCHAALMTRGGARALMNRDYFRQQWQQGRISAKYLNAALEESGLEGITIKALVAHLDRPTLHGHMQLVTDLLDIDRKRFHQMAWREEVIHQISQFCAAEFDQGQTEWRPKPMSDFYATWRQRAAKDKGMAILMGVRGLHHHFESLPTDTESLITAAADALEIKDNCLTAYFHSLLLSINGWASWCAYRRWQAKLTGQDDPALRELLAIRLAWEWVLFDHVAGPQTCIQWHQEMKSWLSLESDHLQHNKWDWIWQRALELSYQAPLIKQLRQTAAPSAQYPAVQAVFCIDVRSEVFRRVLEAINPNIQTCGFAGFFGLPIAYRPLGYRENRPQLPGLLAPAMELTDAPTQHARYTGDLLREQQQGRLAGEELRRQFRWGSASTFSYVEATGLFYAWKLFRNCVLYPLSTSTRSHKPGQLAPAIETLETPEGPVTLERQTNLAEGILRNMSLTLGFAPLVLLAGHGSSSTNNPYKSSLDCGACCGQTGEVNARLAATLLNNPDVRKKLMERGIYIPARTHFIAGLHNTTTDRLELFDPDQVPEGLKPTLKQLQIDLEAAREKTLQKRASALGMDVSPDADLIRHISARTQDWSQVRPEWGLAGNAAFIVAPRLRTRKLDLHGRAFLHDYLWREDQDFRVLETIMTAPMIVAHWINMQYYASTVDNLHYGSGNKVLHNVVGGRLGVFEGNGGDLRIGLPLQSLHDGQDWVHQPLRLSVFIEAPAEAIQDIVDRHTLVQQLIDQQWLYLYRLETGCDRIGRLYKNQWSTVPMQ